MLATTHRTEKADAERIGRFRDARWQRQCLPARAVVMGVVKGT
jgi:hypothetical protein